MQRASEFEMAQLGQMLLMASALLEKIQNTDMVD